MIIDAPVPAQIPALRRLWQQAFGDTDSFLDSFFATGFSPDRCRCLMLDEILRSVLYWFDTVWEDKKLAYLYAVATDAAFQGRGLCRTLIENTHAYLKGRGYAGAVLVPGSAQLFSFYEKLGYRSFGPVMRSDCTWGAYPVFLEKLTPQDYAAARRKYLPADSILQEGETLRFLATQADFYQGNDFLLCCCVENGTLHTQELLGNAAAAPGILKALGVPCGHFRTPGSGKPQAMFHPFVPMDACPAYLGLPLD